MSATSQTPDKSFPQFKEDLPGILQLIITILQPKLRSPPTPRRRRRDLGNDTSARTGYTWIRVPVVIGIDQAGIGGGSGGGGVG